MSDLIVDIPAVTVTAEKPKLTTREDFTNLKKNKSLSNFDRLFCSNI